MKKEKVKKVLILNAVHRFTQVEVTESTSEIYKITLIYGDGIAEEEIYRSFRDEDEVYRYCMGIAERTIDCTNVFWELLCKVDFGGNEDE